MVGFTNVMRDGRGKKEAQSHWEYKSVLPLKHNFIY